MWVGRLFGVGPLKEDDWADELGTTAAQSTSPEAIVSYLSSLGLAVSARQNMSIDDLAQETAAGRPVICCCQDYVSNDQPRSDQAAWDYGHWMVCTGVVGATPNRVLFFQDSSMQNMEREPGGDVTAAEEDSESVLEIGGLRTIREADWAVAWHDEAVSGLLYDHYGITVGLPVTSTPTTALVAKAVGYLRASFDESKHPRGNAKNPGEFGSGGGGAAASKGGDSGASKSESGKKSGGKAPTAGKEPGGDKGAGGNPPAAESDAEPAEQDEGGDDSEPVKRPAVAKGAAVAAHREGKGKDAKIVMADGSPVPAHITPAMISPAWQNVQVYTNPESEVWVKATMPGKNDKKDAGKAVYKPSYEAEMAAAKFTRKNAMQAKIKEIDSKIQSDRANPKTKDAADVAFLMREQATRPGSEADTKGVAKHYGQAMTADNVVVTPAKGKGAAKVALKFGEVTIPVKDAGTAAEIQRRMQAGEPLQDSTFWLKSHGATTLEGRHVVKAGDGVHLQFVGKEGVWHDHLIANPQLASMLLARKESAGDGKLFGVNDTKAAAYVKTLDHGRLTPKDLRTNRANEIAAEEVGKFDGPPRDADEGQARKMAVATTVSKKLGNQPEMCIERYIDPSTWLHPAFGGAA